MIQASLLPDLIERVDANPVPSADSPGIGVSFSQQRYVLKVSHCGLPRLQATEWLCHGLAFVVGLPVPVWGVCQMPDGREVFGSRMEGGVLAAQVSPLDLGAYSNPEVVGHTLGFDLFVGNNDRHPGNWLPTRTSNTQTLLRPIDFSRAQLGYQPLKLPPWSTTCNSHLYYQLAAALGHCPKAQVIACLNRIERLPKDTWRTIVGGVPTNWLSDSERRDLVNWWLSPMWRTRLHWIKDST